MKGELEKKNQTIATSTTTKDEDDDDYESAEQQKAYSRLQNTYTHKPPERKDERKKENK